MKARGLLLLLCSMACGPTVGDPCTTDRDCLGRTCLNDGLPGGYCTLSCSMSDPNTCPAGSVCIRDAIRNGVNGCFRSCASTRDCRSGYSCEKVRGSSSTVCVTPGGV
ncbi:MAG: hypothetical protein IPJ65_06120 [Archangiaceae bacterium]|nr:hypothetical protein [Archangiaceae bacterium]